MGLNDKKTELLARAYFVVIVFSIVAAVIAFRVVKINVFEGEKWRKKSEVNVKWKRVDTDRGNIYADDESLLATSAQFFEIRMDMTVLREETFYKNVDSLATQLAAVLPMQKSPSQWRTALIEARKKKNRYFLIAKGINIETAKKLRKLPLFKYGRYGSGYIEIRYGRRTKPFKELASRTIGEDRENSQKVGLEGYFDKFLTGPTDERLMKRVSSTEDIWIPVYDPSEFEIVRGDDLITTINIHLQDVLHHELLEALNEYKARAGTAILMEVKTGAIKAISNLSKSDGVYKEVLNIGIGQATEPGSTFKLATLLALLEDGKATLDTKVDINGGVSKFYDRNMYDSEKHGRYNVTLKEVFAMSSNVGIAKLAHQNYNTSAEGRKMMRDRFAAFGLDKITGVEVEGEAEPKIKDPIINKSAWYGTTVPWMAHGYELTMTPLQILNFYNAVANDGKQMQPYLVSEIRRSNKVVKAFKPKVLRQIASEDNILLAKEALEEVFINGTAKSLKSRHFTMAGKTGTARVNYSNKAEEKKYNASFAGYFPADNPQYSMIVVIYDPKGKYYGGSVAGPVFKSMAEKTMAWKWDKESFHMAVASTVENHVDLPAGSPGFKEDFKSLFDYVGIKYKNDIKTNWVIVDPVEDIMAMAGHKINRKTVPDVRGMGARDAMYVLENIGLAVSLSGSGKVYRQSISPGTKNTGQRIEIYLN
jgi:cell division protein FtsI (penicillin-binding protein 3)